ncbi:lysosomal acid glucosylceramidase-like [Tribolium madens]|uniref:lysosomal acid glucosylceramidase-like n=1 Tax=Tribolium madens TaxID=41895 RepID=UPI001CF74294|nr:lysosomal acid glucosylceramidase-like [Tribolium madens]
MVLLTLTLALLLTVTTCISQENCLSRDYGNGGTVCVCNSEHCDTFPKLEKTEQGHFQVYTSNKDGQRFQKESGEFSQNSEDSTENQVIIDRSIQYQQIEGFGGAFTDSVGINIGSLDENVQKFLLQSYFSNDGIEYSLCRIPIGGTDYSTRAYTYDDGEEDPDLNNFALTEEDFKYKIPYMKQAMELRGEDKLRFLASPWMVPKWIKTNGKYDGLGFIKPEMYQTWASYFLKFLENYKKEGIEFWAVTTQNEPSLAVIGGAKGVGSTGWDSEHLAQWVTNNLGPTIKNESFSDVKIIILDDQKPFLPWYVNSVLRDKATQYYVDGIAIHWYFGLITPSSVMDKTHKNFPDKFIISTEASCGFASKSEAVLLGSWNRGEAYAIDIMEDLQNWVVGWVDWNMCLNQEGGPTYIDNFVDAPIIVNASANEFYKNPMFYALGHFSKFLPVGSIRVDSKTDLDQDEVMVVAFQRPDDGITVIILNKKEEPISVSLFDETRGAATINISQKSVNSILYW